MRLRTLIPAALLLSALATGAAAQDAASVVATASKAMDVDTLNSITSATPNPPNLAELLAPPTPPGGGPGGPAGAPLPPRPRRRVEKIGEGVFKITRRGVGASDHPAPGYGPQRRADDVLEAMTAIGMQKPILVGSSCGGDILHTLGGQHPDRLGGLVIWAPPSRLLAAAPLSAAWPPRSSDARRMLAYHAGSLQLACRAGRPCRRSRRGRRSALSSIQRSLRDSLIGSKRSVAVTAMSIYTVRGVNTNCADRNDVTANGSPIEVPLDPSKRRAQTWATPVRFETK